MDLTTFGWYPLINVAKTRVFFHGFDHIWMVPFDKSSQKHVFFHGFNNIWVIPFHRSCKKHVFFHGFRHMWRMPFHRSNKKPCFSMVLGTFGWCKFIEVTKTRVFPWFGVEPMIEFEKKTRVFGVFSLSSDWFPIKMWRKHVVFEDSDQTPWKTRGFSHVSLHFHWNLRDFGPIWKCAWPEDLDLKGGFGGQPGPGLP